MSTAIGNQADRPPVIAPRLAQATESEAVHAHGAPPPIDFAFDSFYDVLGVTPAATPEQVSEAAFEQVKLFDRRAKQGDESANERMALINKAKDVLASAEKRAEYDRQPDTVFLSIQDPAALPRLEWLDGIRLIEESLVQAPEGAVVPRAEERPNALLETLLR